VPIGVIKNDSTLYRRDEQIIQESYRKDDRAMRPTYGCPENFRESLSTPTATFPEFSMGFCSDRCRECAYTIWN